MSTPIELELNDGSKWSPTDEQIARWQAAYVGLDVRQQLLAAAVWVAANPTRRKTLRGAPTFCVNWLGRANNAGSAPSSNSKWAPADPGSIAKPRYVEDPDMWRHIAAADKMAYYVVRGLSVPDDDQLYKIDLGRMVKAVNAGTKIDPNVDGDDWMTERTRRSAVHGTLAVAIRQNWSTLDRRPKSERTE